MAVTDVVPRRRFFRLSMGVRLFLILLIALLPLAVVAVLVNQSIADTAAGDRARLLQENVEDSGERLRSAIRNDLAILSAGASQIALGESPNMVCSALTEALGAHRSRFSALLYANGSSDPSCRVGPSVPALNDPDIGPLGPEGQLLPGYDGAILRVQGREARASAVAFYTADSLLALADPLVDTPVSQVELRARGQTLKLTKVPEPWDRNLNAIVHTARPVYGLALDLRYAVVKRSPPQFLGQVIPFLTVLAAAIIGWMVVNRMLVSPITQLQMKLRRYETGKPLAPMERARFGSREIDELDKAFGALADRVALDKQALDEGLRQQILLTREVHHRVKNNLQIIASLISLHARTAETAEAELAYAKIQRRVDALSVVHRNHFAETEQREGINLRALVSELASSFHNGDDLGDAASLLTLRIENVRVDQDVGVPIAFLLTEILELIRIAAPEQPIEISAMPVPDDPARVMLQIASPALSHNPVIETMLADGIDRVMTGLARQLRAPLDRDTDAACIRIAIPLFKPAIAADQSPA